MQSTISTALLRILSLIVCAITVGCGGVSAPPVDKPASVKGRVVASDGKPIGNVALNLQPLESGYAKVVELQSDGTFTVETQPGKYAYFFGPKAGSKSTPSSVSKYLEANMDRTVTVTSGGELEIKLP